MATKTKIDDLIKEIGALSVLELADLIKALEEKFGVVQVLPPPEFG